MQVNNNLKQLKVIVGDIRFAGVTLGHIRQLAALLRGELPPRGFKENDGHDGQLKCCCCCCCCCNFVVIVFLVLFSDDSSCRCKSVDCSMLSIVGHQTFTNRLRW
jgi:hypothetical protein